MPFSFRTINTIIITIIIIGAIYKTIFFAPAFHTKQYFSKLLWKQ